MKGTFSRSRFLVQALAAGLGLILPGSLPAAASPAARRYRSIRMAGESMSPTLRNDQLLKVDTGAYKRAAPQRGDIVLFHPPGITVRVPFVKRVVGLPGEVVRVFDGHVYINGRRLHERYAHSTPMYMYPPHRIPAGSYFLLGDNRNNSLDSHLFGPVPHRDIVGKVVGG